MRSLIALTVLTALILTGCGKKEQTSGDVQVPQQPARSVTGMPDIDRFDLVVTESGLQYFDLAQGTGSTPDKGQTAVVHYTGWLTDGNKFDSSIDRGQPFSFPVGERRVIRGWDEGVSQMKVGGKRILVIPPELGYGDRGAGSVIPPGATLVFEVELLEIRG